MKATKHEPHFLLCMIVNSDFANFISLWFSGAQVHLKYMSMLFYKFVSQTSFLQRNFMDLSVVVILISWLLLIFFIFVLHFPRLGLIPPCQMLVNPCRASDSNQYEDTLMLFSYWRCLWKGLHKETPLWNRKFLSKLMEEKYCCMK